MDSSFLIFLSLLVISFQNFDIVIVSTKFPSKSQGDPQPYKFRVCPSLVLLQTQSTDKTTMFYNIKQAKNCNYPEKKTKQKHAKFSRLLTWRNPAFKIGRVHFKSKGIDPDP